MELQTDIIKVAELILNEIVDQTNLQGFVAISTTENAAVSKLRLTSKKAEIYSEIRLVTFKCGSLSEGKEKYLVVLPPDKATELAASLLKVVAKIKKEEGE